MRTRTTPWYRTSLVDLVVRLLYYSGVLHCVGLIRKFLGKKRLIVLMYHRLTGPGASGAIGGLDYGDAVPCEHFDGHMRLLRWFGLPVSVDEGYTRLVNHSPGPRTLIAVTFDDGYRDNFVLGTRVWKKYRLPVTVFPAVSAIDRGEWLWWDELLQIVGHADSLDHDLKALLELVCELVGDSRESEPTAKTFERMELVNYLVPRLKLLPMEIRDDVLDELACRLGVRRQQPTAVHSGTSATGHEGRVYMTWAELHEQAREGVQVGGHTVHHPSLPFERADVARQEIQECRVHLESKLGRAVTCFAYPGGFHGDREVQFVREAGYRVAVTVEKGVNGRDADPYRLRRIAVSWDHPHHLAFKLAFCEWLFR